MTVEEIDATREHRKTRQARRSAVAGGLGTLIEYYDYSLYGFTSVFIAPLFFATADPAVALISTLAVLGTGYLARPLGGIFFGILGDRRGRRLALIITVAGISIASVALGLLPTYEQIGILAPILLVVVRLAQGFCAGGELSGAATFVAESAPAKRRGLYGSVNLIGLVLGFAFGATVTGVVSVLVTPEQMAEWGWRIPFLLAAPLAILTIWARSRLEDTPEFREMQADNTVVKAPVRAVIKNNPFEILKVSGVSFAMNGAGNIGLIYMSVYLVAHAGFDPDEVYWVAAIVIGLTALFIPVAGNLADKWGRKPVMTLGMVGFIVMSYPVMLLMESTSSLFVAAIAYQVFMLPYAFLQAPAMPSFTELFPRRYRYTGVALGFNIGTVIVGGTAPFLAELITESTGNQQATAFVVIIVCLIGLVAVSRMKETNKVDLPI